jgi:Domain of unknown function(DUF2779)
MITKRTFLTALDCDTAGWFAARAESVAPGAGLEWRFYSGAQIGRLARKQLGDGTLLPFAPTETALAATARAMGAAGSALLFEATFVAGVFIARADALRRREDGWDLIEVKSALAPEDGVASDEQIDDLAYTGFVATSSGVTVARFLLMCLSRDSRLGAEHLAEVDVTGAVRQRMHAFADRAAGIAAACAGADWPEPTLQFICRKCDFFATDCVGKDVPDPLFLLPRLSEKRFDEMKAYQRLAAVPPGPNLTGPQHRVFNAVRSREPLVDQNALTPLRELVWPVYYLDFEAVQPALPWFAESAPYDIMPFQYSIHVCDRPGHEIAHHEYLAPIGADWREELAVTLIDQLGHRGSIVVYSSYEKQRLAAMARTFPRFEQPLLTIIDRLVDLEPVVRNGYCHPEFLGRTSIKNVLPVVAPELSYASMDVGNGEDAAGLFALMTVGQRDAADRASHRRQLLEYCKLDTLAMVRLHAALDQLAGVSE